MPLTDLINKLLSALPLFGRQIVALLLGPKTAILKQDLESDSALRDALIFLAVSFGLAFIAEIPVLPGENKELTFGILAIGSAVAFAWNVAFLILAWKIVGGKLTGRKVIVVTSYFSGVSTIIFLSFYLLAAGTFKMLDPVAYDQMIAVGAITDASAAGAKIYYGLILLGLFASFAWIFCVWGAYRELMGTSRLRSACAMIIFFLSIPLQVGAQSVMTILVMPAHGVPGDLVGRWHVLNRQTDTNGVIKLDSVDYFFSAPDLKIFPAGTYGMVEVHSSGEGGCLIQVTKEEIGRLVVQGSTITLMPWSRTRSVNDQCTGKRSKTPADLSKSEYQYQLSRESTPWKLCLSDRFGRLCLSPAER